MRNVRVGKDELVAKVVANRERHRERFEKALGGWHKRVVKELEERLLAAKGGDDVDLQIYLPQPEDHTADYDRVIEMLNMELRDEVELAEAEFAQLVMDDWGWKKAFMETSAAYIAPR